MTNYFQISRGVCQGCPLSPSLFILAVELLALKIRQSPQCKGIHLPGDQEVNFTIRGRHHYHNRQPRVSQITYSHNRVIWDCVRLKVE